MSIEAQQVANIVSEVYHRTNKVMTKIHFSEERILYNQMLERKRAKAARGQKIRVGFIVIYESSFPARPLFEKMLTEDLFVPFIIVAPDTHRGAENMMVTMEQTYTSLSSGYDTVYRSYDAEHSCFIDFSDELDMVCSANPYDAMTHRFYTAEYLSAKSILSFYTCYGYPGLVKHWDRCLQNLHELSSMWRLFIENRNVFETAAYLMPNGGANILLSGYCKMDALANVKEARRERKRIIIAPHHTVAHESLHLSNFMKYSDFFLELPARRPAIDFVFRPHPLLLITLSQDNLWGKKRVEKYIMDMTANPNVSYDTNAEYLDLFVNSDGLIQDCSSFLFEYMYTDHPQCYMLSEKKAMDEEFTLFGCQTLEHTYKAFSEEDIMDFIDNVIIGENDHKKTERVKFANTHIKLNYPRATEFILDNLKASLLE